MQIRDQRALGTCRIRRQHLEIAKETLELVLQRMRWGIAIALLCACGESHTADAAATTDASSDIDAPTQMLTYLDERDGTSRWSRSVTGSLTVDDEGYWLASNVGEGESFILDGESFDTEDGMAVFARFDLDNTVEFIHTADTRGVQATALQGVFGFDQFANVGGRLYAWMETRNGDRASQLAYEFCLMRRYPRGPRR